MQLGAGHGLQQSDHRGDDAALLDKINLALKDGRRVVVKTDDESALHFQSRPLDAFHVGNQIAALVLALVAFGKARFFRSLDADKNLIERRRGPSSA